MDVDIDMNIAMKTDRYVNLDVLLSPAQHQRGEEMSRRLPHPQALQDDLIILFRQHFGCSILDLKTQNY